MPDPFGTEHKEVVTSWLKKKQYSISFNRFNDESVYWVCLPWMSVPRRAQEAM